MIVNVGKTQLMLVMASDITYGQWGVGTANFAVAGSAGGLYSPVAATNTALDVHIVSGNILAFSHSVLAGSATGVALAEFGLKVGSTGTAFYNRIPFSAITKTASDVLTTLITLDVGLES